MYLKSDDAKNQLRIWSTHSDDLSRESSAAVSSRYIPNSELLLECPRYFQIGLKHMEIHQRI